jgi:cytidylate kinase
MIITIDGAAGTGKSTVAKKVAEQLKIAYFDTGAMYRAFAYHAIHHSIDPHQMEQVIKLIPKFSFTFEGIGSHKIYYVNNEDVTAFLRTPVVTDVSSVISQYLEVRSALHAVQKEFAKKHDAVFEGRDLGTIIFPHADYKFFLVASDEVRAKRRFHEMTLKGIQTTYEQVLSAIRERDSRDEGRKVAPLKRADDALVLDTSYSDAEEVVAKILDKIGEQ